MLAGGCAALMVAFGIAMLPAFAAPAQANPDRVDGGILDGAGKGRTSDMAGSLFGDDGVVTRIITIVIFIVGTLCVIMLIWGGIQYILSSGDSAKVTGAKNTILYAVIGLIVCIVAYAVVAFVLTNLGNESASE